MKCIQRQSIAWCVGLIMVLGVTIGCGLRTSDVSESSKEETMGEELTIGVPATEESAIEEPATVEPTTEEPTTEEPTTEEPTTEESTTEEPTTEEPTTEEPTTEEPTTEEPTVSPFDRTDAEVIEYILTPSDGYFRIVAESIEKVEDKYVITGNKIWGGLVLLTEEQKVKLDNGAILTLIYEGEVIERYVATDRQAEFHPDRYYYDCENERGYRDVLDEITPSAAAERYMFLEKYGEWVKRLEEEPYHGKGYYLAKDFPPWPCDYVIETECQWVVSGELNFYPENYITCYAAGVGSDEEWTIERFYQEAIIGREYSSKGRLHHVYVKDGVIVKITEQYIS